MGTWWSWLFESRQFKTPLEIGWTRGMNTAEVGANAVVFVFSLALCMILIAFRWRGEKPRFFRDSRISMLFTTIFAAYAAEHLMLAVAAVWPAHRLLIFTFFAEAITLTLGVGVMIPIFLKRDSDQVREERHAFANKVNVEQLGMSFNLTQVLRVLDILKQREEVLMEVTNRLKNLPPVEEIPVKED